MRSEQTKDRTSRARHRRAVAAVGLVVTLTAGAAVGSSVAADDDDSSDNRRERADVMVQGGGDVYQRNGARLIRTDHSVEVEWRIRTPEPGSYTYPTPDMVPPGSPTHPPIVPGAPEVFTLWLFAFDHPELCTDGVCDGDDVGDTAARGSVYQADGEIADRRWLRMGGKIRFGQTPARGHGLENPLGAEVHVAMAPHGMAWDGEDLAIQLNGPVGAPPLWFAAIFDAP
ncbi:MAG: hypothetical protein QNJ12_18625 [Ilumatobacter sp.]|uniref:hypothetical protein n=1 Tax=Ilumatobacter sp. TaxID=1967498 RepID=UPI00263088C6|nr:hypothetical protein [Ilumatobacter sp.]MDJ0770815.1 hypothetical protein [Ilumatobacter sp.]